jgi:hypothetical protein
VINFREIFNTTYGYIGLGIILLLFLLIIIINRDIKKSFNDIGRITITSGIINIIIYFLIKLLLNVIVNSNYIVFIEVISKTLFTSLLTKAFIWIFIGLILLIIGKFMPSRE